MTTFLYFAYGSNMLTPRLVVRCRTAAAIGRATATGHRLAFDKRSKDGSGKATLIADPAHTVPGVLVRLDVSDQSALDKLKDARGSVQL